MLFGQYEHTLDDKGRLVIPRKFRQELGNKLYIMKGFEGALSIFKEETFLSKSDTLESLSFNKESSRAYIRNQLASMSELEMDKSGRVQIPSLLLTKYNISKEVVIIGVLDHLEVWDKIAYLEYENKVDENFEAIAEEVDLK